VMAVAILADFGIFMAETMKFLAMIWRSRRDLVDPTARLSIDHL
jgi:hypothetical protein